MKVIRLYGELAKLFGPIHRLAIATPAEAVRALSANFDGFEKYLLESSKQNLVYKVTVDERDIDETELSHPMSREIHIAPILKGAASASSKFIIGAVLIAAGAALYATGYGGIFANVLINSGVGFVLGGIAQSLTQTPKGPEPPEAANNQPSYAFNGPVNTSAQGQPVPIGYGRLIVGGAVISAGISIADISPQKLVVHTPVPLPPVVDPNYAPTDDYPAGVS